MLHRWWHSQVLYSEQSSSSRLKSRRHMFDFRFKLFRVQRQIIIPRKTCYEAIFYYLFPMAWLPPCRDNAKDSNARLSVQKFRSNTCKTVLSVMWMTAHVVSAKEWRLSSKMDNSSSFWDIIETFNVYQHRSIDVYACASWLQKTSCCNQM